jgi:hypothetical protein
MTLKIEHELVNDGKENPFVIVFDAEYKDRGIVGEGKTESVALRNAARNLKKKSDELFNLAGS